MADAIILLAANRKGATANDSVAEVVPDAVRGLATSAWTTRAASNLFERLSISEAEALLIELLDQDQIHFRRWAMALISRRPGTQYGEDISSRLLTNLTRASQEKDMDMYLSVVRALEAIGGCECTPELCRQLETLLVDPDVGIRAIALYAAGCMQEWTDGGFTAPKHLDLVVRACRYFGTTLGVLDRVASLGADGKSPDIIECLMNSTHRDREYDRDVDIYRVECLLREVMKEGEIRVRNVGGNGPEARWLVRTVTELSEAPSADDPWQVVPAHEKVVLDDDVQERLARLAENHPENDRAPDVLTKYYGQLSQLLGECKGQPAVCAAIVNHEVGASKRIADAMTRMREAMKVVDKEKQQNGAGKKAKVSTLQRVLRSSRPHGRGMHRQMIYIVLAMLEAIGEYEGRQESKAKRPRRE
jgi:hypothetical protein